MTESSQRSAPEIPDFDLIRPIGSGGFGEVWIARNRTTRRLRAIKLVSLARSQRADAATREITSLVRLEASARCRHPNLLAIHHVGQTAEYLFYVMDPADDAAGGPATDRRDYCPATLEVRLRRKGDRCLLPERPDQPSVGARCFAEKTPDPFSTSPFPRPVSSSRAWRRSTRRAWPIAM